MKEKALADGGFAGVDMGDDADVADAGDLGGGGHFSRGRSIRNGGAEATGKWGPPHPHPLPQRTGGEGHAH